MMEAGIMLYIGCKDYALKAKLTAEQLIEIVQKYRN